MFIQSETIVDHLILDLFPLPKNIFAGLFNTYVKHVIAMFMIYPPPPH